MDTTANRLGGDEKYCKLSFSSIKTRNIFLQQRRMSHNNRISGHAFFTLKWSKGVPKKCSLSLISLARFVTTLLLLSPNNLNSFTLFSHSLIICAIFTVLFNFLCYCFNIQSLHRVVCFKMHNLFPFFYCLVAFLSLG